MRRPKSIGWRLWNAILATVFLGAALSAAFVPEKYGLFFGIRASAILGTFGTFCFAIEHFVREGDSGARLLAAGTIVLVVIFYIITDTVSGHTVGLLEFSLRMVVFGITLYVFLCEWLLRSLASFLTRTRGEKWVKELDYFYLFLGAAGILGS